MARPLITPDEAMRLGANEALIFTSGRPAIRATKLRYYAIDFSKGWQRLLRHQKSDRIDNAAAIADCEQPNDHQKRGARPKDARTTPRYSGYHGQTSPCEASAGAQLSFLEFAVEGGNGAADPRKRKASRREHCEATTHCLPERRGVPSAA